MKRAAILLVLVAAGTLSACCPERLSEVDRGLLLRRISDLGNVAAAGAPDDKSAAEVLSQTATLRSDVAAQLR